MQVPRPLKTLSALLGGQAINAINQLTLPPILLRSYGIEGFGTWITLTSAVSYLSTLNFGLQTYANNHVGISHSRGEVEEAQIDQATAFAVLSTIVITAVLATLPILLLPVDSWLRLRQGTNASLVIYLLGLQILSKMLLGFLAGSFLAVGISHRGTNWNNAQTIANVVLAVLMALKHSSFAAIAAAQAASTITFTLLVWLDLRKTAPTVLPRLPLAQRSRIKGILGPSGYFAMLYSSNFLVYQLPVVIMERLLGPANVVIFSLTRTIYSMSRQALTSMTWAIGPEIVELHGKRDWPRLLRLYGQSETLVFALVPVVSVGTFLATPILFVLWLHKPQLYDLKTCMYFALISAVMGIKEHKYQFQVSSNEHSTMARFLFGTYLALVAVCIPAILRFGVGGFLAAWLATEVIQVVFILNLNRRYFGQTTRLDFAPVYKLGILMIAATIGSIFVALHTLAASLTETVAWATVSTLILSFASYQLFNIGELSSRLSSRIFQRSGSPE